MIFSREMAVTVAVVTLFFSTLCFSTEIPDEFFKEADCIVPGTVTPCSSLVDNLPWKFTVSSNKKGEHSKIIFTSYIKNAGKSVGRLQVVLDVITFESKEQAVQQLKEKYGAADSDMGLSYAWDFVVVQENYLYHLHSGCILSDSNFITVVDSFKGMLALNNISMNTGWAAFLCRCGGPCRMLE